MKAKAIKCVGLTGILLLPAAVQALEWNQDWSDWEVRPRISTGFMQYEYKQQAIVNLDIDTAEGVGAGFGEVEVDDTLLFAEFGASLFLGNFFVDVSLQKSDEGDDSFTQDAFSTATDVNDVSAAFLGISLDTDRTIEREEFSLSVGYAITENTGVFAGYKRNTTDFDDEVGTGLAILSGVAAGDPNSFSITTDVTGSASSELEQDGFFLGATYVIPYESDGWLNGALSFDLGVAFLNGDLSFSDRATVSSDDIDFSETNTSSQDTSGDAVGINLGVAWSGPLTDRLNYSVGVDGYQYDYEGDSGSADFEDTLVRFSIGISYAIDGDGFR